MAKARIIGSGSFLPETCLTNFDVEKICDTSDEWIRKRTGIEERHFAEDGVGASDLGTEAARRALADAEVEPEEIDLIVCATVSPDQVAPGTSYLIQANLGASRAAAFDVNAACAGFVYGLASSTAFIEKGLYRTILLVGAETTSRFVDWNYRDTAVLFADGAGAVVLRADEDGRGVLGLHLGADGASRDILSLPSGGFRYKITAENLAEHPIKIQMNGRELFKRAVTTFESTCQKVLQDAGMTPADVDIFIPHQANDRITEAARERLGLRPDQVVSNIAHTGNTVAASIPIALDEARRGGRVKDNDVVLFAAFGAGLTWGSALMRW